MADATERRDSFQESLCQIEVIRAELHRQSGGRYDSATVSRLLNLSQELDRLVVAVTRELSQPVNQAEPPTGGRLLKLERGRPQ